MLTVRLCQTAPVRGVTIVPVRGIAEIHPGDDLVAEILRAIAAEGGRLEAGDVLAVAQKVVSKAEGRLRRLDDIVPGPQAVRMAEEWPEKDARTLQAVLDESRRIVRWERGILITETHHGFVCANAGVDRSNAGAPDTIVLLPTDPDASAARLRDAVRVAAGVEIAVVITDTFGRAWREGHVNVAIGIAGLPALERYMGQVDPEGYELRVTEMAIADEVAAASELVQRKLDRCPVAIVRGLEIGEASERARTYVRPAERDLFR